MGACETRPSQNILTRLTGEMLADFTAAGFWGSATIYSLARAHAALTPEKPAVRDSLCLLTYGELVMLADRLAEDLVRRGLRPGNRVAAWLSSRVEMAVFLLACSRNGLVFCPSLHRNHTTAEIVVLLKRMRASVLVAEFGYGADADTSDLFTEAQKLDLRGIYRLDPPKARTAAEITEALELTEIATTPEAETPEAGKAGDVVYIAFTSGTTGEPKGVMHSNNTLLANARALARDWAFDSSSIIYTLSPLSHNLGFGALILAIQEGAELVLHDIGRGARLLDRLRETAATFVFGVPAHALDLLNELEGAPATELTALKGFRISGAAVAPWIVEKLLDHGIVPQSGYGMTEAGSHHYTLPSDARERIMNTSGRACAGYEVRIFSADNSDEPLGSGQIGQIGGRGASLMLGYYDDQTATEASFNSQGWFMTGDLGRLDDEGYLQITGRLKDVIIRGGHNIYPARIESLTMRHPQVERAAAVPVKDERLGEKVCLVVMPRNGGSLDPQALLAHLHAEGLSKYDMPEYFLQVEDIPLSAGGKMLKRMLIPPIAEGRLTPRPVRWQG